MNSPEKDLKTERKPRVGDGTPGPGRPKGLQNRVTLEVKAFTTDLLNQRRGNLEAVLDTLEKDDPVRAAELYIKLIEICMPKTTTVESTLMAVRNEAGQSQVVQRVRAMLTSGMDSPIESTVDTAP